MKTRNELFRQGYLMGLKRGKQIISESMEYPESESQDLQEEMIDDMSTETDVDGVINEVVSEAAGEEVYGGTEYDRACELGELIEANDVAALSSALEETTFGINARDNWGVTPLMWAAHYGYLECLNVLLSYDDIIDVNCTDNVGNTALIEAIDRNHPECVEALLKAGADPNKYKSVGTHPRTGNEMIITPLYFAENNTERYGDDKCEVLVKQYGGKSAAELGFEE